MTEDYAKDFPKKGDKLFRGDLPDWQHNAVTGSFYARDDIAPWHRYMNGYREAADRVVESLLGKEARGMMDVMVYPVVFLYRHHFELALKAIIRVGGRLCDQGDVVPHVHELIGLWRKARPILEQHWPNTGSDLLDIAEELLTELDGFDPRGQAFRYPEERDGTTSLPNGLHINLRQLAMTGGKLSDFLSCCAEGLWNDLDLKETYLSDMRSMFAEDWGGY